MSTTPNLPSLPNEDGYMPIIVAGRLVEVNGYRNSTMKAYALAAYQAEKTPDLLREVALFRLPTKPCLIWSCVMAFLVNQYPKVQPAQ